MNSYVARQPILDKNQQIYAYELLFRSSGQISSYTGANADQASAHTIMDSFYTIGIDTITGRKPAFINFTSSLLLEDVATLFPKELLVIEILEDIEPTREIIAVCRSLRQKGYILALDDFVYRPEYDPLIEMSKIIKFDFLACSPREINNMISSMDVRGKLLLAEKVETFEVFDLALKMGFSLFQGYFFSKPVTMKGKRPTPLKMNYLMLLKEMSAGKDMDYGRMADIIRRDVALCHNLLRMVNSVYYGMRSKVTDLKYALAILGTKEIKKWIYFLSMMELGSDKPDELVKMSMIRGVFLEQLAACCHLRNTTDNLFLLGIFSLLDILMDLPMEFALADLILSPEVSEALIDHKGKLYNYLLLIISIENGNWNETDRLAHIFGVSMRQISDIYLKAVKWCNDALG